MSGDVGMQVRSGSERGWRILAISAGALTAVYSRSDLLPIRPDPQSTSVETQIRLTRSVFSAILFQGNSLI